MAARWRPLFYIPPWPQAGNPAGRLSAHLLQLSELCQQAISASLSPTTQSKSLTLPCCQFSAEHGASPAVGTHGSCPEGALPGEQVGLLLLVRLDGALQVVDVALQQPRGLVGDVALRVRLDLPAPLPLLDLRPESCRLLAANMAISRAGRDMRITSTCI